MSNFNSADIAAFKDVWVFCEQREGKLMPTDFELISKGRDLADELGVNLCGLLLGGEGIESAAKELGGYGADKVYYCNHELLDVYTTDAYTKVICDLVEDKKPEIFLIGATNIGRDLGPRCAARLHTGLCADCTHLDVDVEKYKAFLKTTSTIDVDNTNYQPTRIHLDADWTNRFLGTDIPKEQMVKILTDLQFQMEGDEIIVPSFRSDVEHKADIAEEIARFYGYNNIPTTIAKGSPEGGYNEYQKFERVVNQNMLAQGMYEIMTYSFVSPKQYDKIRLPKDDPKRQSVVIRNPLGEDTSIMRTNAIPSMMDILSKNYNNRNGAVSLYEIGNEYIPVEGELLPDEVPNLVLGMYGDDKDFFTLKGVVENLLDTLPIREYDVDAKSDDPTFHPGRCAVLSKDGEEFGIIGEVHPLVCANYGINTRVYVGKFKLRKLFAMMDTQRSYVPMPKFPASTRDLALLCDDALPVMTMEKAIKAAAGKILEKIELFDVYKGSQIAEGKKSVAFNISMRASDRTLTDEEVNGAMSKILKALEELGAQIRS